MAFQFVPDGHKLYCTVVALVFQRCIDLHFQSLSPTQLIISGFNEAHYQFDIVSTCSSVYELDFMRLAECMFKEFV